MNLSNPKKRYSVKVKLLFGLAILLTCIAIFAFTKKMYQFYLYESHVIPSKVVYYRNHPLYQKIYRAEKFGLQKKTLSEKIALLPEEVMNFLFLTKYGNVSNYSLNSKQKQLVNNAYTLLPKFLQETIKKHVVRISFVKGYRYSGLCHPSFTKSGKIYSLIIINAKLLEQSLDEWINEKENKMFRSSEKDSKGITVSISNRHSAILAILLHETAHAFDFNHHITPYTDATTFRVQKDVFIRKHPYTTSAWIDFRERLDKKKIFTLVRTYQENIPLHSANKMYTTLIQSPHSSIYGTLNWSEDFADMVMLDHLVNQMSLQYEISVRDAKGLTTTYRPLENPRVKKRIKIMHAEIAKRKK
ncbi:MAG: hypothetical protein AAF518_19425 [Spirochaetota bacterium]